MELQFYLRVLRRNWRLFISLVLFGAAAAAGYSAVQVPMYASTAQAYVSTGSAANLADLSQGGAYTQQVVASYAHVATTGLVLQSVISDLGLHQSDQALAKHISVSTPPGTSVLEVTVTDPSAKRAAAIADAVVARLQSTVTALTPDSTAGSELVRVTRIDQATPGLRPVSPNIPLLLLVGALAGLLTATVLAVLRQLLDTRLRDRQEVAEAVGLPVLGALVADPDVRSRPVAVLHSPLGIDAEAYRSLRTNLQFLDPDGRLDALVVTSSVAGEGKSVLAGNLAASLAGAGQRVLLVDADLRRPRQADLFGVDGSVGLSDVVIGRASLDSAAQPIGTGELALLPSGALPPNPAELLQSQAMAELIAVMTSRYDVVIFDTPPLLAVADAAILARRTAGALLTASVRKVRRHQLREAVDALNAIDARVLGLVVTMLPRRVRAAYRYGSTAGAVRQSPVEILLPETAPSAAAVAASRTDR
ncbi:MAG: tyrosine-protein kinase [Microbacteriaceae bacterium]|nr:tyrosine-protein kinase [Microbacteriaceae bacterium]